MRGNVFAQHSQSHNDRFGQPHRITLNQTNTTLHGGIACGPLSASSVTSGGAMMASTATITNAVSCASLATSEINMSMPGLSSDITVNGAGRLSSTQLNTRILGDLEVTGNLSSANGGGRSVDLSDDQKHASAHLAAYGMESYYATNNVDFHPNPPRDHYLSWGNFTHVCNNVALHGGPNIDASTAYVEFDIPANANSWLVHILTWSTGGFDGEETSWFVFLIF